MNLEINEKGILFEILSVYSIIEGYSRIIDDNTIIINISNLFLSYNNRIILTLFNLKISCFYISTLRCTSRNV